MPEDKIFETAEHGKIVGSLEWDDADVLVLNVRYFYDDADDSEVTLGLSWEDEATTAEAFDRLNEALAVKLVSSSKNELRGVL